MRTHHRFADTPEPNLFDSATVFQAFWDLIAMGMHSYHRDIRQSHRLSTSHTPYESGEIAILVINERI